MKFKTWWLKNSTSLKSTMLLKKLKNYNRNFIIE